MSGVLTYYYDSAGDIGKGRLSSLRRLLSMSACPKAERSLP